MKEKSYKQLKNLALTAIALLAFAMNSILCRLALGEASIDAASFSTIRLFSGACILWIITSIQKGEISFKFSGNWVSAIFLFLYVITFSFAYVNLSAGMGALILFGSVQVTMVIAALFSGERPYLLEWIGLLVALIGLGYLVSPGLSAPPLIQSTLMAVAGISWGLYTFRGKKSLYPLFDTTSNFIYALPFVFLVNGVFIFKTSLLTKGIVLAILSGAFASGIGYAIWYAALKGMSATQAATVQLAVPILAAIGGVLLLSEHITIRLILSSIMILSGIGIAPIYRKYTTDIVNK